MPVPTNKNSNIYIIKQRKKKKISNYRKKTRHLFARVINLSYFCIVKTEGPHSFDTKNLGEVAEWSIAPVLKTDVLKGTGGSNPSLSARKGS